SLDNHGLRQLLAPLSLGAAPDSLKNAGVILVDQGNLTLGTGTTLTNSSGRLAVGKGRRCIVQGSTFALQGTLDTLSNGRGGYLEIDNGTLTVPSLFVPQLGLDLKQTSVTGANTVSVAAGDTVRMTGGNWGALMTLYGVLDIRDTTTFTGFSPSTKAGSVLLIE